MYLKASMFGYKGGFRELPARIYHYIDTMRPHILHISIKLHRYAVKMKPMLYRFKTPLACYFVSAYYFVLPNLFIVVFFCTCL